MAELSHEQKELIADRMIAALQEAFDADPSAMHALVCNRVPTTQAMVDHPHMIVEPNPVLDDQPPTIGLLGVLNGVLDAAGLHKVASNWDPPPIDEPLLPHTFTGFCRYRPAQPAAE
jgi:hypothetical protein